MSETMVFTPNAAKQVKQLITQEQKDNLKLRLYITGGGCSGFSYGFKLDDKIMDTDTQIDTDGVSMLVDHMSIQYLEGSKVDYLKDLQGSRFVVENPNATATCGCGSSFAI
jgi:iron-sulfur cluster insertion protein